ncbi:MAG: IS1634 family transposase [Clostridiaceae bacterium]|nr:IS1634 family transposase [Clostridiaceae bacterium]
MRLNKVISKNTINYYVIKDVVKDGKRTTTTVEALGNIEQIRAKSDGEDPEVWAKNYVKKLNRELKQGKVTVVSNLDKNVLIEKEQQRSFNAGHLFVNHLFKQLGLDDICAEISKGHKQKYNVAEILSTLISTRFLYPSSKKSSLEYAKHYFEPPKSTLSQIYSCLKLLAKHSDFIQEAVYKNSKDVTSRNNRILYYDCTNYYFEIEQEAGFKRYGVSKEKRPNPLVNMGLFMDGNGLPLAFHLYDGNKNEQTSLKPLEQKVIQDFGMSKIVVCTDAGLSSTANRRFNSKLGRSFITTQSLKKLKKHLKEWALDPEGWKISGSEKTYDLRNIDFHCAKERDRIYYKSCWINEDNLEQQFIVSFSPKYKIYQETLRERQIERAKKNLQKPSDLNRKRQNDPKRFIKRLDYTDEGEVAENQLFYIDENAIAEEAIYDGFYAVCTNLDDNPLDIIAVNKNRWEIETAFRDLKTEFRARPVYLQREDCIEAHFLICFLALLIYRIMYQKISRRISPSEISGGQLLDTLKAIQFFSKDGDIFEPNYTRTDITDALHEEFGFRTDTQYIDTRALRKLTKM